MTRHLIALILLIAAGRALAAGDPYYAYTHAPTVYYKTILEGCQDLANARINSSWTIISFHSMVSNGSQCAYTAKLNSSGQTSAPVSGQTPVKVGNCQPDETDTLAFPLGRQFLDQSPYQDFGFSIPNQVCLSGCMGALDATAPDDTYALDDADNPGAQIAYSNLTYKQNGQACSSSDQYSAPAIPPLPADPCVANPQAEGCPGGGDTGGGDTGGGDTGGGDTGGGDTGGGDTGGGDTGGGDTGGGDTGGGDTGGGDTGGGDSGGDTGAASGTDCGTSLSCTGDAVGCAIARIQKDFSCRTKEGGDFPAQKDALKQLLGDPQLAPEPDTEINVGELFNRGTRFLPAACPPPKSLSLITNGGRAFEISYDPLCQLATDLGYLIVVAASIFYAIYVGRAAGGE